MGLSSKQAEVAAKWWTDQLRRPTFKTLSPKERSDPGSAPAAMAEMMATAYAPQQEEERLIAFQNELQRVLETEDTAFLRLSVDYNPSRLLAKIAERAGISTSINAWPWKTTMRFDGNGVQVSLGYGTAYQELLNLPSQ